MKEESSIAVKLVHYSGSACTGAVVMALMVMLMLVSLAAESGSGGKGPVHKSDAVKFEDIPGSSLKRVILTAKAAERLGIETGKVTEERIIRKQIVGGRIIPPDQIEQPTMRPKGEFASFTRIPVALSRQESEVAPISRAADEEWVVVTLSPGEWNKLLKDQPVRVIQLPTRGSLASEVLATPSGMPPVEDAKRAMLKLYYRLPKKDHGLTMYHRVRVELPFAGSADKRVVVPYSAVYYDAEGTGWVYVNPEPLVYERQRINIERVEGDLAVISDGPPLGTQVVTVGAPLLYGAEVVFRR